MSPLRPLLAAVALAALTACAKPVPPPAAANDPIPLTGAHDTLEAEQYLHYAVGAHVDAPPEVVWALLTDAAAYPDWNSTVVSLDGAIALGETIKLVSTVDPGRTFKLEVSAFEPDRRLVWEDGNDSFRGVRTFTLTPAGGGTDVTMKEALTGTMLPKIAPKLPDFGPSFDAFMADLKAEAERRSPKPVEEPAVEPDEPEEQEAALPEE
ncbi:MAG: SRPBCC domain-containing protein [Alphaproteobacteria bacterium]|nr:SRPBCC domain-containing protein [Alphaproteobacteria bacterium]